MFIHNVYKYYDCLAMALNHNMHYYMCYVNK